MSRSDENSSKNDDLIVITGAGGFIGGSLARYFHERGFTRIRSVDKKPLPDWSQQVEGAESLCLDLSREENCRRVCEGAVEVYNLAADTGGTEFTGKFRIECLRNVLINAHLIEAAYRAGVERYFYPSSVGVYNTALQKDPNVGGLKESDAYPALAERGHGWEKLVSEIFCQEYWAERKMKTAIARFHSVYGPNFTWKGGREQVLGAICRKVLDFQEFGLDSIEVLGNPAATRSFMYIDDCTLGIDRIMHCDQLIAKPVNLGSSEQVSVEQLVDMIAEIAGVKVKWICQLLCPEAVDGRNSDNTLIRQVLNWEPSTPLRDGLTKTYAWVKEHYHGGRFKVGEHRWFGCPQS
ncbi:MAG: NAD-dependent epimerase/dehydratase family protein [Pirellulales bacterium]